MAWRRSIFRYSTRRIMYGTMQDGPAHVHLSLQNLYREDRSISRLLSPHRNQSLITGVRGEAKRSREALQCLVTSLVNIIPVVSYSDRNRPRTQYFGSDSAQQGREKDNLDFDLGQDHWSLLSQFTISHNAVSRFRYWK